MGHRHIFAKISHLGHFVGVNGMDNATRTQEKQRFKHGMREQVEHGSHVTESGVQIDIGGNSQRYHHESDLRNGRESEHPFNIGLHASNDSSIKSGNGSYPCNQFEHFGHGTIHREQPSYQINTGYNHRSGMDKRRYRSRTFHRIGQPYMQREHSRLTCTSHKDKSHSPSGYRTAHKGHAGRFAHQCRRIGHQCSKIESLGKEREDKNTDQKAQVGETGNDKSLLRSRYSRRLSIIKSDEQIGRNTYQLPENIHLENVRRYHQPQHGEAEQRQKRIITLEPFFSVHIAHTINMNHQRHGCDNNQHHHGNRV